MLTPEAVRPVHPGPRPDHVTVSREPRSPRGTAIVAHHNAEGRVERDFGTLCGGLAATGFAVVVVSTAPLTHQDLVAQTGSFADVVISRANEGFDFASWRVGLAVCQQAGWSLGHVILTNNSVFGPLWSLDPLFHQMTAHDVWGMVESAELRPHIQSWWMSFSRDVTRTDEFTRFWGSVESFVSKSDLIMSYELTWAEHFGAVPVVPATTFGSGTGNPMLVHWRALVEDHQVPFLKKRLFRDEEPHFDHSGWRQVIAARAPEYDAGLITPYLDNGRR